jgi:hypothetical protein
LIAGFSPAILGMRNPLDSWNKSDSYISPLETSNIEHFVLGEKDKELSQKLAKAGSEHRKHLRQIQVWANITLPRFVWQEMDTYTFMNKISCSTMHTLMNNPVGVNLFDEEDVSGQTLIELNRIYVDYQKAKESKDKALQTQLKIKAKRKLPEGFLQMRSCNTNYECLINMHFQRELHELYHWHIIDAWIMGLPYFPELTGIIKPNEFPILW